MKKFFAIATFHLLFASASGQLADMIDLPESEVAPEGQGGAQAASSAPAVAFSGEEILRTWGWLLADRFDLGSFEFTDAEVGYIHAGISGYVKGEQAPTDPNESMEQIQQFFVDREQRILAARTLRMAEIKRVNMAKEVEFFDQLFGQAGMQALGSGLYYQIIRQGSDKRPSASDSVLVNYEGRYLDNTVFDTTVGRGPTTLRLDRVIAAWSQAVPLIGEGGKIKIYAPYRLAYGEDGDGDTIPPAATLVFEIELIKVLDPAATEPAAAE